MTKNNAVKAAGTFSDFPGTDNERKQQRTKREERKRGGRKGMTERKEKAQKEKGRLHRS